MTQGGARIGISMAWSEGGAALMRLSQLLVGVIAARLLTEHDFGVYAVALVAYSVIVNVSDLGVSSALIREHDALDRLAPTAVSLSLVTALALAGVMFVAAPFLADAMGVPDGVTAIQVLALVVLLGGPGAVPAALLTRDFRQDVRFWADLANFFIGNAVMIPLALAGWGALALAWSRVVGQVCSVVILLAAAPRRYRPGFDPTVARELLTFGGPLVGSRMAGLALSSVDVVTLGRMQGAVPLGRYALASNVSSWPLGLLEPVLINVGLPLVSRLRRSQEQLRSFVELSVAATAGVFFLISATIAALAEPLVLALYTAKWADAIPILSVLALAGFVRVFLTPFADVLIACQATRAQMFVHLAWLVALIPATIVGVSLAGPLGAAYAQLGVVTLIVVPLTLAVVRRVAGTPLRAALATAIHPLLSGSAAAVGAYGVSRLLPDPWLALLAGGLTSVAIYLLTTHRWLRDHLARARALASTVTIDAAPADLTTVAASGRGRPRPAVHRPRPLSGEPTVSVVIPCFNYARYVPEAVGSVLEQRGVVVDIIIVDDCSTDDSLAVARGLADEHPQVQVLANAVNAGPVATFNRGLAQARGEFLVRLDADDLLTPGSLGRAVALFQRFPGVGLVYGHPVHFTGQPPSVLRGRARRWLVWRGHDWLRAICADGHNVITSPEVVMRSSAVARVGGEADLPFTHDMEHWLRIAAFFDVGYVEGADQALHRDHPGSHSVTNRGCASDRIARLDAFETLFAGPARSIDGASDLLVLARQALVAEALADAQQVRDRGKPDAAETSRVLHEFAASIDPSAVARRATHEPGDPPPWAFGVRFARAAARGLNFRLKRRRWSRRGMYERT